MMVEALNRRTFLKYTGVGALAAALPLSGGRALAAAPDFLAIGAGPSGGVFNIVATGIADILRGVYPDTIIDVQPGGSGPNLLRVQSGQADLGLTSASNAWDAWNGKDPATPEAPVRKTRGLMSLMQSGIQIWVDATSDIHSLADLRGKQVSAGQPGQTSWNAFKTLLEAAGMSMADIEADGGAIRELSWAESHNALRNGQLDAVMWLSLFPHPSVRETETARPIRTLSLDAATIDRFLELTGGGYEKLTLPKGLYGGQAEEAHTVGTSTFLFASEDMPDDLARAVVEAIWARREDFKSIHALLAGVSEESVGRGMGVPIHPGALAFYKEQGIPVSPSTLVQDKG
ncbi:TAXI family TRAP transporter solute-binding subunit [Stappia taiwanensis]|uniref:TAXI family TRAP transporter solute-binding subunit n=1 Tax=Stappia taiwanensis TaxID=992267 RepID=A0A838XID8_9HYPH|nr:TAXI family TRAP transporter solute-binding subunit [Stappia taiwanensis]MBA4610325.1 TAXI family TRAP transporter solute-binding subunit [Stappia taiwanensis]GGE78701.1 hypothetical protein GCM10007285_03140 [Stappia taiwanensis]